MQNWKIVLINIIIFLLVITDLYIYTHKQRKNTYEAALEAYENTAFDLNKIMVSYMTSEQHIVNTWANIIDGMNMTMEQAVNFTSDTQDNNAHFSILWEDDYTDSQLKDYDKNKFLYGVDRPHQKYETTPESTVASMLARESNFNMTSSYIDPISGRKVVAFGQRIKLLDNGKTRNALLLYVIPIKELNNKWAFAASYDNLSIALIEESGNYFIQPKEMKNTNFYEFIYSYNQIDQDEMRETIFGKLHGSFIAKNNRDEKIIYCFSVITETYNHALLIGMPLSNLKQNKIVWQTIVVPLVAMLVALVTNIIFFNSAAKKAQEQYNVILKQGERLSNSLAESEKANRAKTLFLNNMSHDIRTPMNAIIGFTNMMEKNLNDEQKVLDCIDKIKKASNFLLSLINNVLEMARIESGKMELEETAWNLEKYYDTITAVFADTMKEKSLEFTRSINVKHKEVLCDTTKLREIFLNLLSNAVKYTPEGGHIEMSLTELPSDKPGYAVYKSVISDTGIGMSQEFVEKIFDQFSRERSTTDSKIEGTGLGMSIVKKLVDCMDGEIHIKSKLQEGTQITVIIPLKLQNEEEAENSEITLDEDFEIFQGKSILMAEDNDLNAEIAITILKEYGFSVDRAIDGICCLEMFKCSEEYQYDLILMDIQMPNMNGYDATVEIRKLNRKDSNIPIIAMTANAFDEDRKKAKDVGMNSHIAKPIEVQSLLSTLATIIREE